MGVDGFEQQASLPPTLVAAWPPPHRRDLIPPEIVYGADVPIRQPRSHIGPMRFGLLRRRRTKLHI